MKQIEIPVASFKKGWNWGIVASYALVFLFLLIVGIGLANGFIDMQRRNTPLETAITRCLQYESAPMVMVDRAIYVCDELPLEVR